MEGRKGRIGRRVEGREKEGVGRWKDRGREIVRKTGRKTDCERRKDGGQKAKEKEV